MLFDRPKCSRPECTNEAMQPLQSDGAGWLCRGHAGQPLVGPIEAKFERLYSCATCGSGMDATAARASLFCDTCRAPKTQRAQPASTFAGHMTVRDIVAKMEDKILSHQADAIRYALSNLKHIPPLPFVSEDHGGSIARIEYPLRAREWWAKAEPKPPTLREWLGDRVSELGPWADVLREQPAPAGWIERWECRAGIWIAFGGIRGGRYTLGLHTLLDIATGAPEIFGDGFEEALQMALFTRHPAVMPEPRKPTLRTWFGNEEEP